MDITPEVRQELLNMLRQEMAMQEQERRKNKTLFSQICKDYDKALHSFNYLDHSMWYKVKAAIGTLLRAAFQVMGVANLPADKEKEIRHFFDVVFGAMYQLQRRAKKTDESPALQSAPQQPEPQEQTSEVSRLRFSNNLRKKLETFSMKRTLLASLVGADEAKVAAWIQGKAYPTQKQLKRLSEVFGCTVAELLMDPILLGIG